MALEHGHSPGPYGWLIGFLDKHAEGHAHKHGSYWNRDIEKLVADARLVTLSTQTRHLSTPYMLICAPPAPANATKSAAEMTTTPLR